MSSDVKCKFDATNGTRNHSAYSAFFSAWPSKRAQHMAALALNTVANIGGELRILREHLEPVIVMWIV